MGNYSDSDEKMSKCKETKRFLPACFAWIVLLTTTTLFFVFPARYYFDHFSIWIPIVEAVLAIVVIANFTLATFMDPGIIPKANRGEDDNDDLRAPLYKTVEVSGITVRMKWCVTCQFYRPPRCSHCSVCNNCIETFDHHCPWVNNCIGRRNYRFFFMFLMSLSFHMTAIFGLCLYYLLQHMNKLTDITTIISIAIMVVITILIVPIFGLSGFHVVLVSRGRTTNEQVTGKYRGGYNPFSKGCCYNCWFTLCGPQYPGLVKAKRQAAANNLAVVYQQPNQTGGENSPTATGNQVKVYFDNGNYSKPKSGNLPSLHSPKKYHQMLPSNRDMPDLELGLHASQSLDCEPTPPMLRQGSKSNFFLPTNIDEMPSTHGGRHMRGPFTHGSPHPNRQRNGDRSHTPSDLSSPDAGMTGMTSGNMSPTLQQKIRAIGGVPTPFTNTNQSSPMNRRSNPPTPTQKPDFMGLSHCGVSAAPSSSNPHNNARVHQPNVYYDYNVNGGEQRRFLSEGELLYDRQYNGGNVMSDASGPIRLGELASSPQRGVYHWKDNSPTTAPPQNNFTTMTNYYSNPTSPIQHSVINNSGAVGGSSSGGNNSRMYYHHGVPSHPGFSQSPPTNYLNNSNNKNIGATSPNMKKKYGDNNGEEGGVRPSPISRRPMSFVRALEMADASSMEMSNRGANQNQNNRHSPSTSQIPHNEVVTDRTSVYDMNYEISV